jgi:hypothetical protein
VDAGSLLPSSLVNLHSHGVRMADECITLGFNIEFLFKNIFNFFIKSKNPYHLSIKKIKSNS